MGSLLWFYKINPPLTMLNSSFKIRNRVYFIEKKKMALGDIERKKSKYPAYSGVGIPFF